MILCKLFFFLLHFITLRKLIKSEGSFVSEKDAHRYELYGGGRAEGDMVLRTVLQDIWFSESRHGKSKNAFVSFR